MALKDDLHRKLQSQFIQKAQIKLNNDPYYTMLRQSMYNIAATSVGTRVTVVNGQPQFDEDVNVKAIGHQIQEYIQDKYPILFANNQPQKRQPYENVYIDTAERLDLKQIDGRLTLFKEWLQYKLDNTHVFNHGWPGVHHDYLTFDEWLYVNNFDVLVSIEWDRYLN